MVFLESVTQDSVDLYLETGIKSYKQHYLHLWKNREPSPYISESFTKPIVEKELADNNVENFLVKVNKNVIGIVKIIKNESLDEYDERWALLIQKIYLLQEYSGKGYGNQLLKILEDYARNLEKNLIWLDTMKKGTALNFYLKNGFVIHKESQLTLPNAIEEERPMLILTKTL